MLFVFFFVFSFGVVLRVAKRRHDVLFVAFCDQELHSVYVQTTNNTISRHQRKKYMCIHIDRCNIRYVFNFYLKTCARTRLLCTLFFLLSIWRVGLSCCYFFSLFVKYFVCFRFREAAATTNASNAKTHIAHRMPFAHCLSE